MSLRAATRAAMPALFAHEGRWKGIYRHVSRDFRLIDQHEMETRCEFPDEGPFAYVQHNRILRDGELEVERSFGGALRDQRLWWDTDRFSGWGWETHGLLMLRLDRKDHPDAWFTEMIELSRDGNSRMRVWQWFEGGEPVRRTLCDEWRVE
jgi:hypothetical protein